jgi:hypothetical protein
MFVAGARGEKAARNRAGSNPRSKTSKGGLSARRWHDGRALERRRIDSREVTPVILGRGDHMNWFYWNTAWSLFFSLVWFMTITHNPDAQIADAHLRDEAFGG